jgi:hypothetical protein
MKWPSKKRPTEERSAEWPVKMPVEVPWSPVVAYLFVNRWALRPVAKAVWLLSAAPAECQAEFWSKHLLSCLTIS